MPVSSPTIKYETRDRIAWVTLNRPEAMNALNTEIRNAIDEAFQEATDNDDVLVIIVTGEGGKAFSAGADLAEMHQRNKGGKRTMPELPERDPVDRCPKPVIAAIDGYCLAGGLELALCCDFRVATEKSTFGMPEPRRSILAGYGLHNLSRIIPLGEALWIQLSGSPITARRAYDIGLIQFLVSDRSALFAEAERMAGEIKLCAPLAVRAIKRIVKVGRNLPVEYSWKLAESIMAQIDKTEDHLEGPRAFVEKRAPVWKTR